MPAESRSGVDITHRVYVLYRGSIGRGPTGRFRRPFADQQLSCQIGFHRTFANAQEYEPRAFYHPPTVQTDDCRSPA